MNIGFWSLKEETDYAGVMAGMGLLAGFFYPYRIVMMQGAWTLKRLDDFFQKEEENCKIREDYAYFYNNGMDYLLKRSRQKIFQELEITRQLSDIWEGRISYIPGTRRQNKELYEHDVKQHIKTLLSDVGEYADLVFVGCGCGETKEWLFSHMDYLLVVAGQSKEELDAFFCLQEKVKERTLLLLKNYSQSSEYTVKNISRIYDFPETDIFTIPFCAAYEQALIGGRAAAFLKHYKEKQKYREFMTHMCRIIEGLYRKAGLLGENIR